MFLFGPPNIEKLRAHRDVKGLIKATRYNKDSGNIRQSAVLALIEIGVPAVSPLIVALKDKHDRVREAAAEALSEIGAPAVEPLIAALKDKSDDVRKAAAQILGNIGDTRAVKPLIDALKDADPNVRAAVAGALGRLSTDQAVKPLISALKDENSDVRKAVAKALKSIGALAVEQVILRLEDPDKDMRLAAARALGEIEDTRAVEPLLAALKDKENGVRAAAAEALGQLGDSRATPSLIVALNDSNDDVGAAAAGALGQLGDPHAAGPIIDAFNKWVKKGSVGAIETAAKALDKLGYGAIVAPLLPMCEERNLLFLASVVALKGSLEAAARGSREEGLQMLAKAQAILKVMEEKDEQIKQKAKQIVVDLNAQYRRDQSAQTPKLQTKDQFQRYSGSGLCDVCNRDVGPGEAYLVPVDVFYSSKGYRDWLANGPMAPMIKLSGGVDKFIAQSRKMDTTSHSAVCPNCIHMFENQESFGTPASKTMADVLGYGSDVKGVDALRSMVVDTTVSAEMAGARCPAYRDGRCVNPRTQKDTGRCSWNPDEWVTCNVAQLHSMWK